MEYGKKKEVRCRCECKADMRELAASPVTVIAISVIILA